MQLQLYTVCCTLFVLCCSINAGLSLKRRDHARSVDTLRDAVNNAFDALIEVHQAIPKDKDYMEDTDNDISDMGMDKKTADKFVKEIDELEDMITNKEKDNVATESEKFQEKEGSESKRTVLPKKQSKEVVDDEDIDKTFNFLVDVLKKSIRDRQRTTKFRDYLASNFVKKTVAVKKGNKVNTGNGKHSNKEKVKVEAGTSKTEKSNVSHPREEVNDCGNEKKECVDSNENDVTEKSVVVTKTESNTEEEKRNAAIKHSATPAPLKKKKKTHGSKSKTNHASATKMKTHAASTKKHHSTSSLNYDREIKDLVDTILKRREQTKREKLKVALADIFQILENKHTYAEQDEAADEGNKKDYESFIMGKLFQ